MGPIDFAQLYLSRHAAAAGGDKAPGEGNGQA
jgi:hypothetical protein